jgi:phospholipase C
VVLIVQENHTFDAYFGKYCKAPAGSNPTCTTGPDCCEAAPAKEPRGASPVLLDDAGNFGSDRDHTQACEIQQINGGKMDGFVTGSTGADTCLGFGPNCANPKNWALAERATVGPYWTLAGENALADRYFQPIAGGTASNNMYFATAHVQFVDNQFFPKSIASGCVDPNGTCITSNRISYTGRPTIADLLLGAGKTFTVYADGYGEAKAAAPSCPSAPSSCPYSSCILHPVACHACIYDASDVPFQYYASLVDSPHIKDTQDLQVDLDTLSLPSFSFVKAKEYRSEHPNVSTISDGVGFVSDVIQRIQGSSYGKSTLILLTWDEGGGFFDHVSPPASIDHFDDGKNVPYGTRVAMLAIGPFARKGTVSHVTMEHSSVVRFLEYNFLGPVGQLGGNDAKVNNIGSLLDREQTGIPIPE